MLGIMPRREAADDECLGTVSSDEELAASKVKDKDQRERRHSSTSKQKFSLRRKGNKNAVVKDLLPAKLIKTTQVRPNTLNPMWNEKFRL